LPKDEAEIGNSSLLMTEKSFQKIMGYRDLWIKLRLRGKSRRRKMSRTAAHLQRRLEHLRCRVTRFIFNWRRHEANAVELEADSVCGLTKMRDTHRSRFFIIGSQRSGTTLMRLILECHSQIQCYDEESSYEILAGQREADRKKALSGLKVPQLTEQLAEPFLCDDVDIRAREPGVQNSYDGEKLIFMIRDARDTVASMLGLKWWLALCADPVLESKINNDSAFANQYAAEIAIARASSYYQAARAALIWRYKSDSLWDYIDRGYRVLPVRYETLVKWPRVELTNVCRFLSVSFESSLLRHESMPHGELNADGMATGNTNPKRSISDASVGRWRQRFSTPQIGEILRIAGNTQGRLYPEDPLEPFEDAPMTAQPRGSRIG
jgi:Sulfotransferase family